MYKSKSVVVYDKEKTTIFLQNKFTDRRKYWQHIKPRNGLGDIDVTPHQQGLQNIFHSCTRPITLRLRTN